MKRGVGGTQPDFLFGYTSRPLKPLISCERFNEGLRPCDPAKGLALWKPDLGCRGQAPAAVRVARLSGEDRRR